jgi:hypothetical protein
MLQPGVLSDFSWFTVLLPNDPVVVDDEIVWSSEGLKGYRTGAVFVAVT